MQYNISLLRNSTQKFSDIMQIILQVIFLDFLSCKRARKKRRIFVWPIFSLKLYSESDKGKGSNPFAEDFFVQFFFWHQNVLKWSIFFDKMYVFSIRKILTQVFECGLTIQFATPSLNRFKPVQTSSTRLNWRWWPLMQEMTCHVLFFCESLMLHYWRADQTHRNDYEGC